MLTFFGAVLTFALLASAQVEFPAVANTTTNGAIVPGAYIVEFMPGNVCTFKTTRGSS
jgi:hypothetical protein